MNQLLEYPFDGQKIKRKRKALLRELSEQPGLIEKKIAVLGGSTTHDIKEILELFLLNYGIRPTFFESEYAQYWQDAMFGNEELEALQPDIIYIHTSLRNITAFPEPQMSAEEVDRLLEQQFDHFRVMWERLREKYHCILIQNNFEYPFYRLMGNQDAWNVHGRTNFVTRLNQKFYEYAQKQAGEQGQFYINDINYLASDYGLQKWSNPLYWHEYKYALCLDAIPTLAYSVANIIKSIYGKNKKALALDLDNTLWGGIVGDDGVDNLELGMETAFGQVYTEFQQYLKELNKRGILLNVISKNEKENAEAGLKHPQMILKPEDFISIKANWEPKSLNLKQMAAELSLLPESFVFADDNPAEREIIRQQVPGTAVPELDKVENYITAIDRAGYFETTVISADDFKRVSMYRENAQRASLEQSFENYEDYLLSLQMKGEIRPFAPVYMSRIAQLTNKSNQFNLTTRRCTQEEIEQFARDERYITLYGRLEDRFGDNGVVSVVIGEIEGQELQIRLWLMSCRVLKRDMEFAMMDGLVRRSLEKGICRINGYYYPTAKNAMVREFYKTQGMAKVSEDEDGSTVWSMEIGPDYQNKNHVISVEESK